MPVYTEFCQLLWVCGYRQLQAENHTYESLLRKYFFCSIPNSYSFVLSTQNNLIQVNISREYSALHKLSLQLNLDPPRAMDDGFY